VASGARSTSGWSTVCAAARRSRGQARAVEALLERGRLGIEEFEALVPGVHRRTLQRDLRGLVERGVAVAKGAARAVRYQLRDNGS
jgi:DNA-binding HxlR family transcriptional regulator